MEQRMFFWSVTPEQGANWVRGFSRKVSQIFRRVLQSRRWFSGEQKDLIEYIRDALPEIRPEEAATAKAFHEVTDKDLPPCYFMAGDTVVWNGDIIMQQHPARAYCGEGPFKVVRDESYVVAIKTHDDEKGKAGVTIGHDRLVLLNLRDQRLVIAHGGFFVEAGKQIV